MKISVTMTEKDLFDFSMYNSYSGFSGVFNVIFTLAALVLLAVTWQWESITVFQRILLVFCAMIFTVVQPLMLKHKSKQHAKRPGFSTEIHLSFEDDKIGVEMAGVENDLEWDQIWKVIRIKSMYIIKVGPIHAYLIPNRSVEGREQELVEILERKLPESKRKGLKA